MAGLQILEEAEALSCKNLSSPSPVRLSPPPPLSGGCVFFRNEMCVLLVANPFLSPSFPKVSEDFCVEGAWVVLFLQETEMDLG